MAQSVEPTRADAPVTYYHQQSAAHSYSENIKHSRTNFFVLLLAQLYCLITIETTQDSALLSNANTQKLPILETAIGIETFYIIAPIILVIIFFHFQIHLKSFFTSMVQLARAEGRDPVSLVDTYPWFITSSMTRRYAAGVDNDSGFSSWFEYFAGLIFGWYSTAVICIMFWARYLPVHDWSISLYHAAIASVSIAGAVFFLYASKSGLRGERVSGWRAVPRSMAVVVAFCVPFGGLVFATQWMFEAQDEASCHEASFDDACAELFELKDRLGSIGIDAAASLDGAELSEAPANWVPPSEPDFEKLLPVRGATLANADLRYASARDALFVRADLTDANMRLADFTNAAFHGADFEGADLFRSNFSNATFDYARFSGTVMAEIDLSGASLRHADLTRAGAPRDDWDGPTARDIYAPGADFTDARAAQCDFPFADFRETVWVRAVMTRCKFAGVTFDGANLREAALQSAIFSERATMSDAAAEGAFFSGAQLTDVIATNTNFAGADFFDAVISGGDYSGADFSGALLRGAQIASASMNDADFKLADFRDARLTATDFRGSDMRDARFFQATLANVNMGGADLLGAEFTDGVYIEVRFDRAVMRDVRVSGAAMIGASFQDADLRQAQFTNTDLSGANAAGANMNGARLSGVVFTGADLARVDLTDTTLVGAAFTNADLTGANFTNADMTNVVFTGANLTDAVGLTQTQLLRACSEGGHTLPPGLRLGPCQDI